MTTYFIVLPCFNEEKSLVELAEKIGDTLSNDYTIVAIDDGSTDSTPKILDDLQSSSLPLIAIHHGSNRGLAKAIRTGLEYVCSKASNKDLIVTMDADLTHDPRYIPVMIKALRNSSDVVIASRYVPGGRQLNLPLSRIVLSKGINLLIQSILRTSVKDNTSGFRCYRAKTLFGIYDRFGKNMIEAHGFDVMMELLVKCIRCGARVVEIPFILDYGQRKSRSKMKTLVTIWTYIRTIARLYTFS